MEAGNKVLRLSQTDGQIATLRGFGYPGVLKPATIRPLGCPWCVMYSMDVLQYLGGSVAGNKKYAAAYTPNEVFE